jgi:hypothetical protein
LYLPRRPVFHPKAPHPQIQEGLYMDLKKPVSIIAAPEDLVAAEEEDA